MAIRTIAQVYRYSSDELYNQIAREIGELTPKIADRPGQAVDLVNSIERLRGQAETVDQLEKGFIEIENWAVSQEWTLQQMLICLYDEVLTLALRGPGDTWSGRANDGRRCYADGRHDVLSYVANRLRNHEWFPGNDNKEESK